MPARRQVRTTGMEEPMNKKNMTMQNALAASNEAYKQAPGILLFQSDVLPDADIRFNSWLQQEELPALLAIPGFRRARRYRAVEAQPTYLTVYDCDEVGVLTSPAYRKRDDPAGPAAREIAAALRNPLHIACSETWAVGRGTGGGAVLVQCRATTREREGDARSFLRDAFAPPLMRADHVVRIALWEADDVLVAAGHAAGPAHWMLFIETLDLSRTMLALHAHVLSCVGAHTGLLISTWAKYQLMFECEAGPAPVTPQRT